MKVLFIKDAPGGGKKGQVKEVAEGYAKNFLLPKGFVQIATPQLQAKLEKEGKEAEAKKLRDIEKLRALKSDLEKREFVIKVKVGEKGQIFGGVHDKDVAKSLEAKMGMPFAKSQIKLESIIREVGMHSAQLNLGDGIIAKLKIKIDSQVQT